MNSPQAGSYPGQSLGMQQVMNQAGASRQQQQQPSLQGSPNLYTALSDGPSWATIPTMSQPTISNINSMLGPDGPTSSISTDIHSNAQRRPQPQQFVSPNQMLYQEHNIAMQLQQQQKQQQQTQMQMSSATQPSGIPWSQLNSIQQQLEGQGGSFQYQAFMQKQQQHPQATMQNPAVTNNVTDLQLQWLQMQQNQMQKSQMQQNQMQLNQLQSNLIQQNQILVGQQQNQILGSRGAGNMNNMRGHILTQRQAGLLQELVPGQQNMLSLLQLQQQQVSRQQQPRIMQQREMQMAQQRMQGSPDLLPTPMQNSNVIDQKRHQQQQQQQKVEIYNIDSSCSTTQIGHPGDWQEMYQKLKYLKDAYFVDLRDLHQKVSLKLSKLDIAPSNAGGVEQIKKMRQFKIFLEHMMAVLSLGQNDMPIDLKNKLPLYEKQILCIVQNHKRVPQQQPQARAPSDQPQPLALQQLQPAMQSQQLPQKQQSKRIDCQLNQLHQKLNTSTMNQYNCLRMPNTMQHDILNTLQSDQILTNDTRFRSLQQEAMSPTNSMNPPQMVGSVSAIGSRDISRGVTMTEIQNNMSFVQVLKQQQQRHHGQIQTQQPVMLTQQQMQQRQSQECLVQNQQFLQQQFPLQQKVQKQKLQHQHRNQMQQLNRPSEPTDLNSRQGAAGMEHNSMNTVLGPYNINHQSQLKPGSNLPISNQNIQSSIQQISQGIETERPASPLSAGATSPKEATIPSPEGTVTERPASLLSAEFTSPEEGTILSPQGPETERQSSQLSAELTSPEEGTILSPKGPETETSASPLLVEFTRPEKSTILSPQCSETERPALLGAFTSSEVGPILSIKSPESKRPASALLEFTSPETGEPPMKKMKRDISVTGNLIVTDNLKETVSNSSTMQSTATYSTKGLKSEMHRTLLEELHEINIRLIDTELTLNEEEANSTAEAGESIFVNCTYKAIALSPNFWAHFTSSQLSPIMPLRLLVPPEYPKCSPVILDKLVDEKRNTDDFLTRARLKFDISINGLSQPMSLKKIAQTWANCARKVIREYTEQFGGGNFSSRIKWNTVNPEDPYIIW